MAEFMLRAATDAAHLTGVRIESAGVAAEVDEPATAHTLAVLAEHCIDGSNHLARQLTEQMLADADLVLVATDSLRRRVLSYRNADQSKVRLMLGEGDLADPWGFSLDTYRLTARQLAPQVESWVAEIKAGMSR